MIPRLFLIAMLLFGSGAIVFADAPVTEDFEPEQDVSEAREVALAYLRAYRSGNLDALQQVAIGNTDLQRLADHGRGKRVLNDTEMLRFVESIRLGLVSRSSKQRASEERIYMAVYGGRTFPVHLKKINGGWKVDARWWVATTVEPTPAHAVARRFMLAKITADVIGLQQTSVAHKEQWVLSFAGPAPDSGLTIYYEMCANMPLIQLKAGDSFVNHAGHPDIVDETMVGPDRQVHLGLFELTEIPFFLMKTEHGWRVDAEPHINALLANLTDEDRDRGRVDYPLKIKDARIGRCFRGQGDLVGFQELIDEGITPAQATRSLRLAIREYWYNNQLGQLPENSVWVQLAKLALEAGADPNAEFGDRGRPLQELSGSDHNAEMIALLVQYGADLALVPPK